MKKCHNNFQFNKKLDEYLKSPLLKIIFSFLNENKKLDLIINSKKYQKKLFKVI